MDAWTLLTSLPDVATVAADIAALSEAFKAGGIKAVVELEAKQENDYIAVLKDLDVPNVDISLAQRTRKLMTDLYKAETAWRTQGYLAASESLPDISADLQQLAADLSAAKTEVDPDSGAAKTAAT